jgi:hypothetical protein
VRNLTQTPFYLFLNFDLIGVIACTHLLWFEQLKAFRTDIGLKEQYKNKLDGNKKELDKIDQTHIWKHTSSKTVINLCSHLCFR